MKANDTIMEVETGNPQHFTEILNPVINMTKSRIRMFFVLFSDLHKSLKAHLCEEAHNYTI